MQRNNKTPTLKHWLQPCLYGGDLERTIGAFLYTSFCIAEVAGHLTLQCTDGMSRLVFPVKSKELRSPLGNNIMCCFRRLILLQALQLDWPLSACTYASQLCGGVRCTAVAQMVTAEGWNGLPAVHC